MEEIYELQERIRKNATSKVAGTKIVEDSRGQKRVPGEPEGVKVRVSSGLTKIVFYKKGAYTVARLYNVLDSAEPIDLKPEVSAALEMVLVGAANCTPKQFKDLVESSPRIKPYLNDFTFRIVMDAFYERIVAGPRRNFEKQQFEQSTAKLKQAMGQSMLRARNNENTL